MQRIRDFLGTIKADRMAGLFTFWVGRWEFQAEWTGDWGHWETFHQHLERYRAWNWQCGPVLLSASYTYPRTRWPEV